MAGLLAGRGLRVRAASRRASPVARSGAVRFDWYDPETFEEALRGVDRVHLVPPVGDPVPATVMLPFLERARASGVSRAVLLGSSAIASGGPAVGQVQQALPGLFDAWAVLRPSWFMQNFTGDHAHARSIREHGTILTATGAGRVAFVDADDIAAVAVHALTADSDAGGDLVLTGPEALSYDEAAAIISEVTGRPVTHRRMAHEQLRGRLAGILPPEFAAVLAGLDRSIAEGAEDRVTDTVERLTGRPPRSLRAHLEHAMTAVGG
ncbi:NmrA family NAD(P)-binding protein [Streptomyces sp. NPDC058735]|uniref:NmrA family NAD(P)-binding protein n=1 Tax=Streptomyces sp. NPDC058735 TaxID=3346616 RepID=UPI0036BBD833